MSDRRAREAAYAAVPSRVHVGYGRPQHAPYPRPPRLALHNSIELSSQQIGHLPSVSTPSIQELRLRSSRT